MRQNESGRSPIGLPLRIERTIPEVAAVPSPAKEHPPLVMVPVPQLMAERKPAALRRAPAVDRDHRLPFRAHDGRLASIERAIIDDLAAGPGDGLQVDLTSPFDPQAL